MEKLILIDGNSLLNRAFYATPLFTTKDGTPTNAVFGFLKLMLKIVADKNPTHFAVAFDLHAPTFRHQLYSDYKAGRKPMPNELAVQMPILKEVLSLMQICVVEKAGFEADDLIGTLAKKFDVMTYIYTGDRDAYQLVDETTDVCFTRKGVSDILELSAKNFQDEIGLTPAQIIELKSLMGDKSDNIPGVPGIGEKTAKTLLEKYDNLDGIYAHIEEISGATYQKLSQNREQAYFSKTLATIDVNAPIDVSLSDCLLRMPFPYSVKEKFTELEFKSLLSQNVFDEPTLYTPTRPTEEKVAVEEKTLLSIDEALKAINDPSSKTISVNFTDTGICFALFDGKSIEYVLPIKRELLDVGFFPEQLTRVYEAIFHGDKKVIVYNAKEVMHKLADVGVVVTAEFEDVAILKCISDALPNGDSLEYCLDYHGFDTAHKAHGLYALYEHYAPTLSEQERALYQRVELPLSKVLFEMERTGVCVNTVALSDVSNRLGAEIAELTEQIYEYAGEKFNVNSTLQLGKILFETLKIGAGSVKKKKSNDRYKTTAEELEKYRDEHPIIPLVLRYRQVQKLYSTYVEGFKPLIKNGKVHTTYNQINTSTGRLSSSNPNLQNIPIRTEEGRELRKLFKASDGCVLIDADYSQIELRLLAHFSACKELVEGYNRGVDIHAVTASQVFGVSMDEVTPQMRRSAKAVNFGIIYGISAFGLSEDLGISAKKAQEYINKYFESYSSVKNYLEKSVENASENGFTTTLLGRRRIINELKSSNRVVRSFGERAAMNMPLQGSSADIIKIAMINVSKRLQENAYKAKLVLQVHDELVIDCPLEEQAAVSEILKNEMENAVSLTVPLSVDLGVGKTWFDTK